VKVLYQNEQIVAVDKPAGMLVHRTRQSGSRIYALQTLREQLGRRVYPIHRLDRAASGVLLFGLSSEAARAACKQFEDRKVEKIYWAVVRGYTDLEGVIDYRSAVTRYRRLKTIELPVAMGKHATSRYSLVEVMPETGRTHQIRKHFCHIFHPLIGDTTYGEGRHNRLFRERFGVKRLLLWARRLTLDGVCIESEPDAEWKRVLDVFENSA
jgi:tRNA pseudouridine65 synthase